MTREDAKGGLYAAVFMICGRGHERLIQQSLVAGASMREKTTLVVLDRIIMLE